MKSRDSSEKNTPENFYIMSEMGRNETSNRHSFHGKQTMKQVVIQLKLSKKETGTLNNRFWGPIWLIS